MPGYGDFMLPPIGCTANTAPNDSQCAAKEAAALTLDEDAQAKLREALEEHMERPQD